MYGFVGNDGVNGWDYIGLYNIDFENLTPTQQKRVKDSMERVKKRAEKLSKQIDREIQRLALACALRQFERDKGEATAKQARDLCCCIAKITADLKKLKKVLDGMVKDIDSPTKKLHIEEKPVADTYAQVQANLGNMDLSTAPGFNWNSAPDNAFDTSMFHELTHFQGTEDNDNFPNPDDSVWGILNEPLNNAENIDDLMALDLTDLPVYRWIKMNCGKKGGLKRPSSK